MIGSRPVYRQCVSRKHSVKPVAVFQFYSEDGACFFGDHLRSRGVPLKHFSLFDSENPPSSLKGYSGLSFLGGPMSVNDDWDALRQCERLIVQALREDVPMFGHCLGGQLISRALGGRVSAAENAEIGWSQVRSTGSELAQHWFGEDVFPMFQWHNESFSIPPGAELIATGELCRHQAYAVGRLHVGVQFHCEIDRDKIENWLTNDDSVEIERLAASPGVFSRDQIRRQSDECLAHAQCISARMYDRWIERLVR
jgi:GMP synthase-like glutamine amidotransferase